MSNISIETNLTVSTVLRFIFSIALFYFQLYLLKGSVSDFASGPKNFQTILSKNRLNDFVYYVLNLIMGVGFTGFYVQKILFDLSFRILILTDLTQFFAYASILAMFFWVVVSRANNLFE